MDGRDGLQLLPGTKKRLGIKVPGENRFLYVGSAILGAVLVTMLSLARYENSLQLQVKQLNDELVALEQKRNKKDEADLRLTKDRLALTADLIKNHVYWTKAFDWLESLLQREIQIKSLAMSAEKGVSFSGWAASYIVVARQIAVFLNDDRVLEVQVGRIMARGDGTVEFGMDLKINHDKIIKK